MLKRNAARLCERCRQPVRQGSDFLRAYLWGHCSYWHWSCSIRQVRESDVRSAEAVAEVVR